MILADEMLAKSEPLVHLMANRDFTGVLLGGLPNQAWLLPGLKPHTPLIAETSKVLLHISPSGKLTIVAPDNEIEQIKDELSTLAAVEYYSYPWYRDERLEITRHWIEGGRIGSDQPTPNTVLIAEDMERLRAVLTAAEQTRYRQLGSACARILTEVLQEATPGMTEADIMGMVAAKLFPVGIVPEVLLVGSDARLERFRHPHTTMKKVERYVMINLTARQWGLYLSLSRARYFGKLPEVLAAKQQAAALVDATLLSRSRPGVSLGELYIAAKDAYAKAGYPGEEEFHHQGGTAGYRGRERRAQPGEKWRIMAGQAVAWNPTVCGTKSEDTARVYADGIEIISTSPGWPMLIISANECMFERPAIMVD